MLDEHMVVIRHLVEFHPVDGEFNQQIDIDAAVDVVLSLIEQAHSKYQ